MLLQLRDYIRREHRVSLQQLVREFHIDERALQPMLDLWVQKGVILPQEDNSTCQSTCSRCSTSSVVFYVSHN